MTRDGETRILAIGKSNVGGLCAGTETHRPGVLGTRR